MSQNVVIAANSLWYIANFRDGLLRAIGDKGLTPIVIAPPDGSSRGIFDERVKRLTLPLDRSGTNPLRDFRLLAGFHRAFRRVRPVAVFSFTIKPNIYAAIAGRLLGVPVMPTVTGLGTVFIKGGPLMALVEQMYRFAFKCCPVVFFENRQDLDAFTERWIVEPPQARLVPGCGVDLERFAATPLPRGRRKFLLVARLLRDKGVHEFVQAAALLRAAGVEADFQLLGPIDTQNRTAITRAELERWVAGGVVEYLGETDDVRPFISAATAIVLPSYREGLPRSLLEGAAMGRPLIATDVPGCRDVVDDGVTGVLCQVRSGPALAQAIERLAQTPYPQLALMGCAGRAKVRTEFDERVVVDAYLDALDCHARAVSGSRPRPGAKAPTHVQPRLVD